MTTRVQPQSQMLTINGLRLHYLDWGNAGAPPVVCIHGFTSCAQAFNALARHVAPRFHLLVPDGRGHGDSACPLRRPTNSAIRSATWRRSSTR